MPPGKMNGLAGMRPIPISIAPLSATAIWDMKVAFTHILCYLIMCKKQDGGSMKNVTLAIDEKLVEESRLYAREHHTSLNKLIRDLLARTVRGEGSDWTEDCFRAMDAANGRSGGRRWKREDLYDA
jgi:hypothetical protein